MKIYEIKPGKNLRKLNSKFDLYYHKDYRVWGVGIKADNCYFATISARRISFCNTDRYSKEISEFLDELKAKNWLKIIEEAE